jgi:uncharacterized protein YfiM (DUF2279 family)
MRHRSDAVLACVVLLALPPIASLFGADKVKHFFASAFVQSLGYSAARVTGINRANAQIVAGVSTAGVGLLKEMYDKRNGKPFSVGDLLWDAAGATAAASLLNGTR